MSAELLYEVPAPTVALYTLLAMSAVVIPFFLYPIDDCPRLLVSQTSVKPRGWFWVWH